MARRTVRPLETSNPYNVLQWMIQQATEQIHVGCVGEITSVNPKAWTAKVQLQPDGVETGWLPIPTVYGGANYGIWGLPDIGTQVFVVFEGADFALGKIVAVLSNQLDTPPQMNPGELIVSNKDGAEIYLDSQGVITLNGGTQPIARAGDTATGTITIGGTTYPITVTIQGGNATVKA